jgi:hypothetical protein
MKWHPEEELLPSLRIHLQQDRCGPCCLGLHDPSHHNLLLLWSPPNCLCRRGNMCCCILRILLAWGLSLLLRLDFSIQNYSTIETKQSTRGQLNQPMAFLLTFTSSYTNITLLDGMQYYEVSPPDNGQRTNIPISSTMTTSRRPSPEPSGW